MNCVFITIENIFTNISLCCKAIPEIVASRWTTFWNQKSIENAKKRDFDSVNGVLFHKTVSNKFITVQNVVFNILLSCYSIPEFVALK